MKKLLAFFINFFRRITGKGIPRNMYHPDFSDKIEAAFTCGMTTYYRFKQDFDMPVGRYKWVHNYLYEVDLRMTPEILEGFCNDLEKYLSGKKGSIDLIEAMKVVLKLKSRVRLGFEVETVRKLASVVYFTDSEILNTYDRKTGRDKMALWERTGNLDFFMTRPISELLKLKNFSLASLEEFVQWQKDVIKELMPEESESNPSTSEQ